MSQVGQPTTLPIRVFDPHRVLGVVFLILFALDQLPAAFAFPAALGDIVTGMAAPFVARRVEDPRGRSWAFAWNAFGILDLIVAIVLGAIANIGSVHVLHTSPTTEVMTHFPMALVPTFLVPLSMVLHFSSVRYLWMRSKQARDFEVHGSRSPCTPFDGARDEVAFRNREPRPWVDPGEE